MCSLLLALTAEKLRLYIPAPLATQFPSAKYIVVRSASAREREREGGRDEERHAEREEKSERENREA